jgi:DNA-binding HxlR family transcriptional regulator
MPPADAQPRPCAIADALELIGERWSLLVVRELFWGVHRFGEIARNTGAPRDVLSARLRRLVDAGVLEKRQYSERPPRFEYHLTKAGRALSPVLMSVYEWGAEHVPAPRGVERPTVPHGDHQTRPVSHFSCATCGEELR